MHDVRLERRLRGPIRPQPCSSEGSNQTSALLKRGVQSDLSPAAALLQPSSTPVQLWWQGARLDRWRGARLDPVALAYPSWTLPWSISGWTEAPPASSSVECPNCRGGRMDCNQAVSWMGQKHLGYEEAKPGRRQSLRESGSFGLIRAQSGAIGLHQPNHPACGPGSPAASASPSPSRTRQGTP